MDQYLLDYPDPQQEPNFTPSNITSANAVTTSNDDIKALLLALQNNNDSNTTNNNNNTTKNTKRKSPPKKLPAQGLDENGLPITYCWTHGITHNLQHTSQTCQRPAENHNKAATLNNKLGGSTNKCAPRPSSTSTNTRA